MPSTSQASSADFNPRTPCGVRPVRPRSSAIYGKFQSTHPVRGATCFFSGCSTVSKSFQSTHPVRGATPRRNCSPTPRRFQSTHPVRGATSGFCIGKRIYRFQSTHPVRGATCLSERQHPSIPISIHAPRAGCDQLDGIAPARRGVFQSTHPVRGATVGSGNIWLATNTISIHAPRAGCDDKTLQAHRGSYISIHAPRAGCDLVPEPNHPHKHKISIHAPRAGCDGEFIKAKFEDIVFQSTHPVRGATVNGGFFKKGLSNFNPRTPCGVRRQI